jgi:hypothetical protein
MTWLLPGQYVASTCSSPIGTVADEERVTCKTPDIPPPDQVTSHVVVPVTV